MESNVAVVSMTQEQMNAMIQAAVASAVGAMKAAQPQLPAEAAPARKQRKSRSRGRAKPAAMLGDVKLNDKGVTAYETADGTRYMARVRKNGKTTSKGGFETRKEAIEWKGVVSGANKTPGAAVPEKMTMGDLLSAYIVQRAAKGKPLNFSGTRHYERLAAHPLLKDVKVRDIGISVMRKYCEARVLVEKKDPSTVLSEFAFVKVAIKRMAAWLEWLNFNPLEGVREVLKDEKLIGESFKRKHRPSAQDLDKLRAYFREQEAKPHDRHWVHIPMVDIIDLASINAFRRAELLNLCRSEIDREHLLVACRRKDSSATDMTGKRDTDTMLLAASLEIIDRQPVVEGEDRIFPYSPDTVSQRFADACKKCGINVPGVTPRSRWLRFHDLRHEAISTAAQHLQSFSQLMAFSGHKTPGHCKRYVQDSKEEMAKGGKLLNYGPRTATK